MFFVARSARLTASSARTYSSSTRTDCKVLVVGAGSAGLTVSNQLYKRLADKGRKLNHGDIVHVDPADWHHYQPGWTLVGSGLNVKTAFRRPMEMLIPQHAEWIKDAVRTFSPADNHVTLTSGRSIKYEYLIVAAGLQINWSAIKGLPEALVDSASGVSSIYSYDTCSKTVADIEALRSGKAIFTQPAGVIKCAGAPQKVMWQAWDRYKTTGRDQSVQVSFFTGMPTMFAVPKYSEVLNALRVERGIPGYFQHNLTAIDVANRKATFKKPDGSEHVEDYTILHVTPPQGPSDVIKGSPLADKAGWVEVDPATTQHTRYENVFSLGDASSLPTSKTIAAITAESPVLVENLASLMVTGKVGKAEYDGYTSCPLLTGENKLLLAEFKYGLEPKESFAGYFDQGKPQRAFYHLKTRLFPAVYYSHMVKGNWFGPRGLKKPDYWV